MPRSPLLKHLTDAGFLIFLHRIRIIFKKIFVQRLTEPLHLNIIAFFVWIFGSYKQKIAFDLIVRQHYAYAMLKNAEYAKSLGIKTISVLEFGVGYGGGLIRLSKIAENLEKILGIKFKIYGFDILTGMPEAFDYRDLDFVAGSYKPNVAALKALLPDRCQLVIGDVNDTVDDFIKTIPSSEPIGFIAFDVDLYTSTKAALRVLQGRPDQYLPVMAIYFDDIFGPSSCSRTGELLAIREFNEESKTRFIEEWQFLEKDRIFRHANWIKQIRFFHVFDYQFKK